MPIFAFEAWTLSNCQNNKITLTVKEWQSPSGFLLWNPDINSGNICYGSVISSSVIEMTVDCMILSNHIFKMANYKFEYLLRHGVQAERWLNWSKKVLTGCLYLYKHSHTKTHFPMLGLLQNTLLTRLLVLVASFGNGWVAWDQPIMNHASNKKSGWYISRQICNMADQNNDGICC